MSLLTVFSAPKPFTNPHIAVIQRNAIQSWQQLGKDVQVILIGEESGLAETAAEFRVEHIPGVARNDSGTPLVSSIFDLARQAGSAPYLAYVNADVILMPDFLDATQCMQNLVTRIQGKLANFLMIGQRWDLDITTPLDFMAGWHERLLDELGQRGRLHPPAGSDFFIFPRALFSELPDFAIGRAGWDNWMIYHARLQGWQVIDATSSIQVVHQDHDYSHLPGGKAHYDLAESNQNLALAGGMLAMYNVLDSNYQLVDGRLRKPGLTLLRLLRKVEMGLMPPESQREGLRWAIVRKFRRARRFRM